MQAYNLRGAGAVIHSHSVNAVAATMLEETSSEFHCTQLEMIKVGGVWVSPSWLLVGWTQIQTST